MSGVEGAQRGGAALRGRGICENRQQVVGR